MAKSVLHALCCQTAHSLLLEEDGAKLPAHIFYVKKVFCAVGIVQDNLLSGLQGCLFVLVEQSCDLM